MTNAISLQMLAVMDKADLKKVTESAFQKAVIAEAKAQGWLEYHVDRTATRKKDGGYRALGPPGFPDLVLVRYDILIFAELKTERGSLSSDQKVWMDALKALAVSGSRHRLGVEYYTWRPRHVRTIQEVLA